MIDYRIRNYQPSDERWLEIITYRTGFKGEDLAEKDFFNDRRLFYLIFIYYYPRYEPENCFVAEELEQQNIFGFICGSVNTIQKEKNFMKHVSWRIPLRVLIFSMWRYPRTIYQALRLLKFWSASSPSLPDTVLSTYPAHLHINILPEFQRIGVGTRLLMTYETKLKIMGIPGVHLQTTNKNLKAVPFYINNGYKLIHESSMKHFYFDDLKLLTFGKRIS